MDGLFPTPTFVGMRGLPSVWLIGLYADITGMTQKQKCSEAVKLVTVRARQSKWIETDSSPRPFIHWCLLENLISTMTHLRVFANDWIRLLWKEITSAFFQHYSFQPDLYCRTHVLMSVLWFILVGFVIVKYRIETTADRYENKWNLNFASSR